MEQWSREQWETKARNSAIAAYYLYTPLCGTCMVASKMMEVISVMKPDIQIGKADLNYVQDLAIDYEVESVPCLLITKDGVIHDKLYAFNSVPYLLEKMS